MKISELLKNTINESGDLPVDNFTAADLHHLSQMRDLLQAQQFALKLINTPSQKPLQPAKKSWFEKAIRNATSVQRLSKMMWDLLLSGEGHSVIGSGSSTMPSSYRQKFGETDEFVLRAYDLEPVSAMTPDGQIHSVRSPHDVLALPVGSVILDADIHSDGDVRKATYSMVQKTQDTDDLMVKAFTNVGDLDVSPYAKSSMVASAFAEQARNLLA